MLWIINCNTPCLSLEEPPWNNGTDCRRPLTEERIDCGHGIKNSKYQFFMDIDNEHIQSTYGMSDIVMDRKKVNESKRFLSNG